MSCTIIQLFVVTSTSICQSRRKCSVGVSAKCVGEFLHDLLWSHVVNAPVLYHHVKISCVLPIRRPVRHSSIGIQTLNRNIRWGGATSSASHFRVNLGVKSQLWGRVKDQCWCPLEIDVDSSLNLKRLPRHSWWCFILPCISDSTADVTFLLKWI